MVKYFNKNYYNISDNKNILKNIADNLKITDKYNFEIIKKNWLNIIGEKVFNYASPEKIENDILFIKCKHPGWITSLNFNKNNIIKKINEMTKIELKNIIFK